MNPETPPKQNMQSHLYDYTIRPLHAVVLLTYPPVLLIIAYAGIGFMGTYFFNITISNAYAQDPYNFSPMIVGLLYIPNSVTYLLVSIYGGRWNDWLIKRSARLHNGELRPESRLSWNIVLAAVIFPPACMIFGWCLDKKATLGYSFDWQCSFWTCIHACYWMYIDIPHRPSSRKGSHRCGVEQFGASDFGCCGHFCHRPAIKGVEQAFFTVFTPVWSPYFSFVCGF